jgi:hypothetical protein
MKNRSYTKLFTGSGGSALLFAKGLVYYKRGSADGISKDMSDVADQCVPKASRL